MAELEDAETEIVEQEKWGLSRVGLATKRLALAVRVLRGRVVALDTRLDQLEARVRALGG